MRLLFVVLAAVLMLENSAFAKLEIPGLCRDSVEKLIQDESKKLGVKFEGLGSRNNLDFKEEGNKSFGYSDKYYIAGNVKGIGVDESALTKKSLRAAKKCKGPKEVFSASIRKLNPGGRSVVDAKYLEGKQGYEVTLKGCLYENEKIREKRIVLMDGAKGCPVAVVIEQPINNNLEMERTVDYRNCRTDSNAPKGAIVRHKFGVDYPNLNLYKNYTGHVACRSADALHPEHNSDYCDRARTAFDEAYEKSKELCVKYAAAFQSARIHAPPREDAAVAVGVEGGRDAQ